MNLPTTSSNKQAQTPAVLIVGDDAETVVMNVRSSMGRTAYFARTSDGVPRLLNLYSSRISLVLLEGRLDGSDSYNTSDLIRLIRTTLPDVPILSISTDEQRGQQMVSDGCTGWIGPVDGHSFSEKVAPYLLSS